MEMLSGELQNICIISGHEKMDVKRDKNCCREALISRGGSEWKVEMVSAKNYSTPPLDARRLHF